MLFDDCYYLIRIEMFVTWSKPYDDLLGSRIDFRHHLDPSTSLMLGILIDTNGIDP